MNDIVKNLLLWAVIAVVLMTVFNNFAPRQKTQDKLTYSEFIERVKSGNIQSVMISPDNRQINGVLVNNDKFETNSPGDDKLLDTLLKYDVVVEAGEAKPRSLLLDILISWFPMLLLIGVWIFFMRQMQGGGSGRGAMSFGKSKARLVGEDQIKVTFNDVAGVEEAK
ncbi:MAG: ATP-dependent metalloprotease, partial [Nitrosomonadaceae bacterium]|nr:ATP-dependent metalloprotease [Nitrosomonadaceae bacterium]